MSVVNIIHSNQELHLFTDGGTWRADGVLSHIGSKTRIFPHLGCAISSTGNVSISKIIVDKINSKYAQFDALVEDIEFLFMESCAPYLTYLKEQNATTEVYIAGYSPQRQRLEVHSISSDERRAANSGVDVAAWTTHEHLRDLFVPCQNLVEEHLGARDERSVRDIGIAAMEYQRSLRATMESGNVLSVAAGFVQHTTVTPAGISTSVVKRWPDLPGSRSPCKDRGLDSAIAATKLAFAPAGGVAATTVQGAIEELGSTRGAVLAASRTALGALPSAVGAAYLGGEGGRNGLFVWNSGDLSAMVTIDPAQGVYVAPTSDATGASGAWVRDFDGAGVLDVWFGVVRGNVGATSGPDMRAELQAALDFCRARALDLRLTKGSAFVSQNGSNAYCLLNEGVSMIGLPAKSTYSVIAPMPTVPNTADIIRFRPRANQDQDYIQFTRFMINPKQSGTAYGKRAFYMLTDNVCNVGQLLFSRMYCGSGNDYSLYFENAIATNAQGNPSNATISENSLFEGVYLTGAGDNVTVRDNFIVTSVGSARHGVYAYLIDGGGGVASILEIERNAMNANGSAILIDRGRNIKVHNNNIEHSAGAGVNASVINLRGQGGQLSMPSVKDNAIGIFGSSTALIGVNVQACYFAQVRENNIITDVTRTHAVIIGSGSANTRVYDNKVSPEWTNNLTDSGSGTLSGGFVESSL